MKAQDIMTREVATVRPETSVREIAGLMMEKNISGVPVVSDNGAIVGIVSATCVRWASPTRKRVHACQNAHLLLVTNN
jgi:CBS domain-containing protein